MSQGQSVTEAKKRILRETASGNCLDPRPLTSWHRSRPADAAAGLRRIGKGQWGISPTKLEVPAKQPKKARLWLNDWSCVHLRPERPNQVCSCDLVKARAHDGRTFRMLNLIDELSREDLAIRIDRKLWSTDAVDVPSDWFMPHVACPDPCGPATALSSCPRRCAAGSPPSVPERPMSSPDHRGMEEA